MTPTPPSPWPCSSTARWVLNLLTDTTSKLRCNTRHDPNAALTIALSEHSEVETIDGSNGVERVPTTQCWCHARSA
jgi:hypothetical protein